MINHPIVNDIYGKRYMGTCRGPKIKAEIKARDRRERISSYELAFDFSPPPTLTRRPGRSHTNPTGKQSCA